MRIAEELVRIVTVVKWVGIGMCVVGLGMVIVGAVVMFKARGLRLRVMELGNEKGAMGFKLTVGKQVNQSFNTLTGPINQ